jgi:hypothetical protein
MKDAPAITLADVRGRYVTTDVVRAGAGEPAA